MPRWGEPAREPAPHCLNSICVGDHPGTIIHQSGMIEGGGIGSF
ncbi:hypothetical protein SynPROSU1_01842 [Synechococcus sp. PROS-U-1]|nr:hypothetical protein SynPROSU1_01842 [Synechococcus sp. PROS-U-1]